MKKKILWLMALLMVGLVSAQAYNPSCKDLGYDSEIKIETSSFNGTYVESGKTMTINTPDDVYFEFDTDFTVDLVIVKGGPDANLYYFDPATMTSDEIMHAPMNPNSCKGDEYCKPRPYGLSHITFCWDEPEDPNAPEFTVVGAALALLGAGFIATRKRKQ